MLISSPFNRFLHGVIYKEVKAIKEPLIVHNLKFKPSGLSFDSVKQLLKHLDLDYPRDQNNTPLSITTITSKELCLHIEWCIRTLGENGFTFSFIEKEWERLINSARN